MKKYVLRRISDNTILARNIEEGFTCEGLNPDCEYLEFIDTPQPTVPRYYNIEKIESRHPTLSQWIVNWNLTPVNDIKNQMKLRIATRRWEVESGGVDITLSNNRIIKLATDEVSQGKLTGLTLIASSQPISIQWKGYDGNFTLIDNTDVQVMAAAMFNHVQNSFLREQQLLADLALDDLSNIPLTTQKIEQFIP